MRKTIGIDWRPVPDFPYEVSSNGHVRRTEGGSNNAKPGRILKGYADKNGYIVVRLSRRGQVYDRKVHRLVCEAFHGTSDLPEVRHLDGCPFNNNVWNLAWGTSVENAADRDRHGRQARGASSSRAKLTAAQARDIREEYSRVREGRQRAPKGWRIGIAEKYGMSIHGVATITAGRGYSGGIAA